MASVRFFSAAAMNVIWGLSLLHAASAYASGCSDAAVAPAQMYGQETQIETVIALQAHVPRLGILNQHEIFLSGPSVRWVRWDRKSEYEQHPTWAHYQTMQASGVFSWAVNGSAPIKDILDLGIYVRPAAVRVAGQIVEGVQVKHRTKRRKGVVLATFDNAHAIVRWDRTHEAYGAYPMAELELVAPTPA